MSSSRRMLIRISAAYLLLVLSFTPAAGAQDPSATLALNPAIRTGTLPNGLTFFIRRNGEPEKRASLYLAVKAGSIDEADDQRGLAHLLEHMAFNGSAHFKPGELTKYLESIGSRFGPDVNAYTSFDETVYTLELPTDRQDVLDRGFDALSDFAGGMTLDAQEIDRERGVVIEEWRLRQGAGSRMQAAQMEGLFGQSRYVERLPIGLPEILESFPAQRLRDFYRDHYRADRMAVIVVGDLDPAATEARIRARLSGLPTRPPAPRPVYPIPFHDETRYVAVSDREAQSSSVSIVHKRPLQTYLTVRDYRRSVVEGLVNQMLDSRFGEIATQPDSPFLRASSGDQALGRSVEGFTLSARVRDGGVPDGLRALAREIARLRQHGFGEAELERAKKSTLAVYERAFNERDKSRSSGFARELVRHFLTDEPAPGIAFELDLVRALLPTVTADEASALVRELLGDSSRVVLATSPDKEGVPIVTQAALSEAMVAGNAETVVAWNDEGAGRELMMTLPTPGTVRSRRDLSEIGVTVLTLSNGVDVWLKPTDFRNDQISFTSYARGGASLASEAEYLNASLSTALVGVAGVGGFSPIQLDKLLAGRIASASPFMSTYTHGISGGATPRDLETALQLLHLYFTAPNPDPEAFGLMKRRLEASLANRAENPGSVFGERVRLLNTVDHYSARATRTEDLERLSEEQMRAYYGARFANAADFAFFFVGAFTVDDITPLLTRYIASLPSSGTAAAALGALRLQFPPGIRRETVNKGRESRSRTAITFFSDTGLDEFETHRLRAATSVVQSRLRELLREELGGTYSVGVRYSDTAPRAGYGTTGVQFGSSPENAGRLTDVVMAELDRLRREGPAEVDVQTVRETEKRELETSFRQNRYWLNSLYSAHLFGRDPGRISQRLERAESLTAQNIHAAIRTYFPADRHTVVTLMPEVSVPPAASR